MKGTEYPKDYPKVDTHRLIMRMIADGKEVQKLIDKHLEKRKVKDAD